MPKAVEGDKSAIGAIAPPVHPDIAIPNAVTPVQPITPVPGTPPPAFTPDVGIKRSQPLIPKTERLLPPSYLTNGPPAITQLSDAFSLPSWVQLMNQRATNMPGSLLTQHPDIAAGLLSSALPDKDLNHIAQQFPGLHDWIQQREGCGEISGALIYARLKALNSLNPGYRAAGLAFIDRVQQLPAYQQSIFLQFASNPQKFTGSNLLQNEAQGVAPEGGNKRAQGGDNQKQASGSYQTANEAGNQLSQDMQSIAPGTTVDEQGNVIVPQHLSYDLPMTAAELQAASSLFPSLNFKEAGGLTLKDFGIHAVNGLFTNVAGAVLGTGDTPLLDERGHLLAGPDGNLALRDKAIQHFHEHGVLGEVGGATWGLVGLGMKAGALGPAGAVLGWGSGIGWSADTAANHLPGASTMKAVLGGIGAASRHAEGVWNAATRDLGTPIALLWGPPQGDPGSPERIKFDEYAGKLGNVLAIVGLHAAGEAKATWSGVRGQLPDTFAAGQAIPDSITGAISSSFSDATTFARIAHPMDTYLTPGVNAFISNLAKAPVETWINGGAANAFFGRVSEIITSDPANAEANLYRAEGGHLDPGLVKVLLRTGGDVTQMPNATLDFLKGEDVTVTEAKAKQAQLDDVHSAIKQANENIASMGDKPLNGVTPDEAQAVLDELNAKKAELEAGLAADAVLKPTEFRYPGSRDLSSRLHRLWEQPTTNMERFLRKIMDPTRPFKTWTNNIFHTEFDVTSDPAVQRILQSFNDKFTHDRMIYDVSNHTAPVDAVDAITTNIQRFGHRLDWSSQDISTTIQDFLDVKHQQDFYDSSIRLQKMIDKNLPANTPELVRHHMVDPWNRLSDDYQANLVSNGPNGTQTNTPLLADPVTGRALPSLESEFIQHVQLPSEDTIMEASSAARRWARNMKGETLSQKSIDARAPRLAEKYGITTEEAASRLTATNAGGKFGKSMAFAYDFSKGIMRSSTALFKPISLIMHIPAIIMKKTLDESIGNALSPGIEGVLRPNSRFINDIMGTSPEAVAARAEQVGTAFVDGFVPPNSTRMLDHVKSEDILNNPDVAKQQAVWASQVGNLDFWNSSDMVRKYIADGFDPEAMKSRMGLTEGPPDQPHLVDPAMKAHYDNLLSQTLDKAGVSIDQYLPALEQSIKQAAFGDAELLNYIQKGRVSLNPDGLSSTDMYDYRRLTDENKSIDARMTEPDLTPADRRALTDVQRENINQLDELRTKAGGKEPTISQIRKGQGVALQNYIKERVLNGDLQLPKEVRVDRWVSGTGMDGGITEKMMQMSGDMSSTLYRHFRSISKVETRLARGNFFEQRAAQYTRSFETLDGMDSATARAKAEAMAGQETRDMFYDMQARSTFENQTKNLFWYAPLQGEMLYRWMYAIPSQYGLIPGLALNAGKAMGYFKLLRDAGIIRQDATGQWILPTSGATAFASAVSQHLPSGFKFKVPGETGIALGSLTHIVPSLPTLSPLPGFGLSVLQSHAHSEALNGFARLVDPYGSSTELVPSAIRYAAAGLGFKIPDMNHSYISHQYDLTHDEAIQYAAAEMIKSGDTPPQRSAFKDDASYMAVWQPWFDRLNADANQYAKGMYFVKTIQSTLIPGTISMSSSEKDAYTKFFTSTILPQISVGSGMTQAAKDEFTKWYGDHPNSQAFTISYNAYTGNTWQPPVEITSDKYYQDLYLYNIKNSLTPQQYANLLPAMMAKQTFDAQRNAVISQISGTGSPAQQAANLLSNWGERRVAMTKYVNDWKQYRLMHPDAASIVQQVQSGSSKFYGYTPVDSQLTFITETLNDLYKLSGYFTGKTGLTSPEFNTITSKLRGLESKYYSNLPAVDPVSQHIHDYFNNVLDPYFKETDALYKQATLLRDGGKDATSVYDQINVIKNKYSDPKLLNGMPSPDAFFFGSLGKPEQHQATIQWATNPVSWLTDWQRQKVGYQSFQGEDKMYQSMSTIDKEFASIVKNQKVSPSSNYYSALKTWADQQKQGIAGNYGKEGKQALALENASPAERLSYLDPKFGNNKDWGTIMGLQNYVNQQLGNTFAYGTKGTYETQIKEWFYANIQGAEKADPNFHALMTDLSYSLPGKTPGHQLRGVPLYEAIFFNNWNTAYIPKELLNFDLPNKGMI